MPPEAQRGQIMIRHRQAAALTTALALALVVMALPVRRALAANENCNLARPLADALVATHENVYIFVYPPAVPKHYDGCQIMWVEKWKSAIGRFKDSKLVEFEQLNEDGSLKRKCFYTDYKLTDGPDTCPAPEDFNRGGLDRVVSGHKFGHVPPDRDIRLKP